MEVNEDELFNEFQKLADRFQVPMILVATDGVRFALQSNCEDEDHLLEMLNSAISISDQYKPKGGLNEFSDN